MTEQLIERKDVYILMCGRRITYEWAKCHKSYSLILQVLKEFEVCVICISPGLHAVIKITVKASVV